MRFLLLVLAVALHLAIGFFYVAAGLIAPGWAVLTLWTVWLALLVALVLLWRRRPPVALAVPVLAAAVFFGSITAGEQLLGWTA